MIAVIVEKVKTEWRAVQFDGSEGSNSFVDVMELFDWAGTRGCINGLDEYSPCIYVPEKKPTYPGETRVIDVKHGYWIVASSRGKVKVLTEDEFSEKFKEK